MKSSKAKKSSSSNRARRSTRSETALLLLSSTSDALEVCLVDKNGTRTKQVGEGWDLLPVIADLLNHAHPSAIVVQGKSERFSTSRSVITVANVLAYALKIPVRSSATGKNLWPMRIRYSAKPNITKKKVRST